MNATTAALIVIAVFAVVPLHALHRYRGRVHAKVKGPFGTAMNMTAEDAAQSACGHVPGSRPRSRRCGPPVWRPACPRVDARALSLRTGPHGFRHRDLREYVTQLHTRDPETYSPGAMTYDRRRLRLHGLIERVSKTHRYRITPTGAQIAMFYARLYTRALRLACSLTP